MQARTAADGAPWALLVGNVLVCSGASLVVLAILRFVERATDGAFMKRPRDHQQVEC
jgi:hypothetical protein